MADAGGGYAQEGRRRLILVVEDEFLIAMELQSVLDTGGYDVLGPVASVEDALSLLKTEKPDAAVLDVNLNGQRVTPVAQALGERSIPYLIASAYLPADLATESLLARAINVGKPTDAARLLKEIANLL